MVAAPCIWHMLSSKLALELIVDLSFLTFPLSLSGEGRRLHFVLLTVSDTLGSRPQTSPGSPELEEHPVLRASQKSSFCVRESEFAHAFIYSFISK